MSQSQRFFNIEYFESVDKYILSCYSSSNEFQYLILDNQMNIVDNSFNDGKYCLTNITMEACTEDSLPFMPTFNDSIFTILLLKNFVFDVCPLPYIIL